MTVGRRSSAFVVCAALVGPPTVSAQSTGAPVADPTAAQPHGVPTVTDGAPGAAPTPVDAATVERWLEEARALDAAYDYEGALAGYERALGHAAVPRAARRRAAELRALGPAGRAERAALEAFRAVPYARRTRDDVRRFSEVVATFRMPAHVTEGYLALADAWVAVGDEPAARALLVARAETLSASEPAKVAYVERAATLELRSGRPRAAVLLLEGSGVRSALLPTARQRLRDLVASYAGRTAAFVWVIAALVAARGRFRAALRRSVDDRLAAVAWVGLVPLGLAVAYDHEAEPLFVGLALHTLVVGSASTLIGSALGARGVSARWVVAAALGAALVSSAATVGIAGAYPGIVEFTP